MASRKLEIVIAGDASGMNRTVNQVQGTLNGFGSRFRSFAGGMVAGVGAAFAVDKILSFGSSLANLGAQVEVAGIKADTVFGESADEVRAWADDLNEALGLSDEALTGLAANMGDLLKPMGFTSEQAADMSTEMLDLSGALSAWSGGTRSAAEVAEILQSALLGEREQLKGLGISISEADVQQRLLEKGQQDLTGAALAQAEALATQELLFEKSTDAQEAWTNGSMDGVQAQNELKAAWADAQVFLAEKFLPVLRTLFEYGRNVLDFARLLKAAWDINGFQGVIDVLGRWFSTVLIPRLQEWTQSVVTWATETGLPALRDGLVILGEAFWSWLETTVIPAVGAKLGEWVDAIGEWVASEGPSKVVDAVSAMSDQFWSWMNDEENGAAAKIDEAMTAFLDGLEGWITGEGRSRTEGAGGTFAQGFMKGWWDALLLSWKAYLYDLPMFIIREFTNLVAKLAGFLWDIGRQIASNIVDGIKEQFSLSNLTDLFKFENPFSSGGSSGGIGGWVNDILDGRRSVTAGRELTPTVQAAPTVVVQSINPDSAAVGAEVVRAIEAYRRSGGLVAI